VSQRKLVMALGHAPSIITDQLVFAYDSANIKSYKGPVLQNLANAIGIQGTGTSTGYSSTGTTETVDIPGLGLTTVYTNNIQNNYTSFTPNSGNCCPSLHSWGNMIVSPSTLYTYGIVYKCNSGYTSSNYMYRYEFTANGGTYVSEGGVHNDANRIALGNGWYYAWGTFTTGATTNWLGYCGTFYYRYSPYVDRLSVAKVMIVAGNYAGMHPKYWPSTATTRSNTQAILDLTGNNTVTATSLTYNSDGSFSFNGSNSILLPFNSSAFTFNNEQTIIIWMKNQSPSSARRNPYDQAYAGAGTITHENDTGFNYFYGTGGGNNTPYTNLYSSFNVVVGETAMICFTRNTSTVSCYKNGVFSNSMVNPYGAVVTGTNNITIGSGYAGGFGGSIYTVQLYNRALSAAEVQQNFNALRGRYGI
jgi:hypothetical protein